MKENPDPGNVESLTSSASTACAPETVTVPIGSANVPEVLLVILVVILSRYPPGVLFLDTDQFDNKLFLKSALCTTTPQPAGKFRCAQEWLRTGYLFLLVSCRSSSEIIQQLSPFSKAWHLQGRCTSRVSHVADRLNKWGRFVSTGECKMFTFSAWLCAVADNQRISFKFQPKSAKRSVWFITLAYLFFVIGGKKVYSI